MTDPRLDQSLAYDEIRAMHLKCNKLIHMLDRVLSGKALEAELILIRRDLDDIKKHTPKIRPAWRRWLCMRWGI